MMDFIKMDSFDLNVDPLIWWYTEGKLRFKHLFPVAQKYLIMQSTRYYISFILKEKFRQVAQF